jgi:aerobic-type carbon monoxide dehydrogenase small subunit (CoxS/CutS family)
MAKLTISGEEKSFDASAGMRLLRVLRDVLGMNGTKFGCGIAQCSACTVHVDGNPVRSCMLPVGAVRDRGIITIKGIGKADRPFEPRGLTLDEPPSLCECKIVEISGLRNRS